MSEINKSSGPVPFEHDIHALGRYAYTGHGSKPSALLANERQTQMVVQGLSVLDGRSLIDVGCGDGTYTWEIAEELSLTVTGIDPAGSAIEVAKKLGTDRSSDVSVNFIFGDLESTVLPAGNRFDISLVRGVLHHVQDPALLITQLAQCSDSVVVIEPNGVNPFLKLIEIFSPYHRQHMEKSFTPWQLKRWLEAAGWTVKVHRCGGIVPFFFPTGLAFLLKAVEPAFENFPGLRWLVCGSQLIVAVR